MKDIDTKRPRRLDLDAPLLSTRRSNLPPPPIDLSRAGSLRGSSSNRVPFSWEHSPGKPKHAFLATTRHRTSVEVNKVLPLPKPPQHDEPQPQHANQHAMDASFSDLFSLQDSFDTDENDDDDDGGYTSHEPWSPNFMIQRFLPAATALAASSWSAMAASTAKDDNGNDDDVCNASNVMEDVFSKSSYHFREEGSRLPPRVVAGKAYSSTRGCGFQFFFPWRTKHRLCGVKSPVRRVRSTLKPQLTSTN